MALAFPAHLVDTMGSAATSGVEAAGHLLQEAGHTVSSAAENTSKRARKLARLARSGGHQRRARGNLLVIVVLGGVAVLAIALGRAFLGRPQQSVAADVAADADGNPSPSPTSGSNGIAASHETEEMKARDKV